jgi:hypothetical protein
MDLTKERIVKIANDSSDIYECLLNLYKEVLPVEWDKIDSLKPWGVQVNQSTSMFILAQMHRRFTTEDAWPVNSLILNKGFSSQHEDLKDWEVRITEDAFTLKTEKTNEQ